MKPYLASLINALTLIALPLVYYFGSEDPSKTAFISVGFGVAILACVPGVKKENKMIAHISVLLTFVVMIALAIALKGAIGRQETMAIARVSIMLLTTVVAIVFFVKSFIDARKARTADSESSD